jgi:hypothetical protein
MDSLLHVLNSFTISETKTESEFDDLISNMENLDTYDPDEEWDVITANYSKLRYIDHLIELYDFPETKLFVSLLTKVLDSIDKKNQYYLCNLSWENEDYSEECAKVETLFEQSLNQNNPFLKIKYILDAYKIFIPIIEYYRNEKYVDCVDDTEFIKTIENINKRRKIK